MGAADDRAEQLTGRLRRLTDLHLDEIERLVSRFEGDLAASPSRHISAPFTFDWPHAPMHRLDDHGTYMVTAATYQQEHLFRTPAALDQLQQTLLGKLKQYGWRLEAWAIFSNHYHFVAHSSEQAGCLRACLKDLHADLGRWANGRDKCPGRQVWFNFRDTQLTFQKSYLARLSYVHRNPVRHGLVPVPNQYRWCSAQWLERTASPAQVKTIYAFKIDRVRVNDDFEVLNVR